LYTLLHIRRFTMVISAWWFWTSSKLRKKVKETRGLHKWHPHKIAKNPLPLVRADTCTTYFKNPKFFCTKKCGTYLSEEALIPPPPLSAKCLHWTKFLTRLTFYERPPTADETP